MGYQRSSYSNNTVKNLSMVPVLRFPFKQILVKTGLKARRHQLKQGIAAVQSAAAFAALASQSAARPGCPGERVRG